MKKKLLLCLIAINLFFPLNTAKTSMIGGNFEIYSDSFGDLSSDVSTGGAFTLYDSLGDPFATSTSANGFVLRGGFQAQEKGILSFSASGSSVNLGALTSASVSSGSVIFTISTDSETGYTLSATEDGNLRSGVNDIDDVSDGTVTAGSEEYGISASGSDSSLASDTALSGTVTVASNSGTVTVRQTTVSFKAGISGSTADGTYSHSVIFSATANP